MTSSVWLYKLSWNHVVSSLPHILFLTLCESLGADRLCCSAVWTLVQAAAIGLTLRIHLLDCVGDHLHERLDFIREAMKGLPHRKTRTTHTYWTLIATYTIL